MIGDPGIRVIPGPESGTRNDFPDTAQLRKEQGVIRARAPGFRVFRVPNPGSRDPCPVTRIPGPVTLNSFILYPLGEKIDLADSEKRTPEAKFQPFFSMFQKINFLKNPHFLFFRPPVG